MIGDHPVLQDSKVELQGHNESRWTLVSHSGGCLVSHSGVCLVCVSGVSLFVSLSLGVIKDRMVPDTIGIGVNMFRNVF